MAETEKKNDRCFFPDISAKMIVADYKGQLHDIAETLFLRVVNAPSHIWYDADDVKHVFIDGYLAVEQSINLFKKLVVRDASKWDRLEILDKQCSGGSGPVLLMESYTWTAMCILGYYLGTFLGAYEPATSLIRPIFHPLCALILAMAMPFITQARLRKTHWPEDEQRSEAFHASIWFGVLAAYALGKPSATFAFLLPLLPLWIGTVAGYREFYKPCRIGFVNLTLTGPWLIYSVLAFVFFEHSFVYILSWTILCAIVGLDLQLKLGRLQRRWASKELEYWGSTAAIIGTHFLLNHFVSVFAGTSNDEKVN